MCRSRVNSRSVRLLRMRSAGLSSIRPIRLVSWNRSTRAELKDIELARIGHGYAGWPATCLSRLRPIQAGKDVWTVNFIHGTVRRAFVDDSPRAVSDDQFKVSP